MMQSRLEKKIENAYNTTVTILTVRQQFAIEACLDMDKLDFGNWC